VLGELEIPDQPHNARSKAERQIAHMPLIFPPSIFLTSHFRSSIVSSHYPSNLKSLKQSNHIQATSSQASVLPLVPSKDTMSQSMSTKNKSKGRQYLNFHQPRPSQVPSRISNILNQSYLQAYRALSPLDASSNQRVCPR
jgi:hypothetical protein